MSKLVSVIIPCYNQDKYLSETLNSISNQTYTNWECIIVDDGSVDDSAKIAASFVSKDSRFIYIYKKNGGVSSARNLGINLAKGSYIQFLDSDDILDNLKLELSLAELSLPANEDVKIAISNFKMISHDSKESFPPFCVLDKGLFNVESFLLEWNVSFSIQMQCGFFDISLFESIRFSENLSAQEDWVVWVQIFKIHDKFIFIDKPLAYYRMNPESRMMTLGVDDNQLKVVSCFRDILTYDEFYTLSFSLVSRYYNSDIKYRNRLNEIKRSNSYQSGLMIKKVLKSTGALKLSRYVFKIILNIKKK
jgi:glycosyltransferase involved in cell wall biosynthesis